MNRIINFQISLFGSFIDIRPKTDIIIKLLSNLQSEQFVPGTIDIAAFDAFNRKITTDSRMQLFTLDKTWSIVFLAERIDINYNYQENSQVEDNLNKVVDYSLSILEKVFYVFPATTGNRLAMNCKLLLKSMSADEIHAFIERFSTSINANEGVEPTEWQVQWNVRKNMNVGEDISENCNRITELSKSLLNENNKETTHIMLSLDNSTLAENNDNRFTYNNLKYFARASQEYMTKIIEEVDAC